MNLKQAQNLSTDLGLVVAFDKACELACSKSLDLMPVTAEVLALARDHERRPLVLKNLQQQIAQFERAFRTSGPDKLNEYRRCIIEEVACMFMQAIKLKRDQDNWSLARRLQETSKESLKQEMASILKDVPRGTERDPMISGGSHGSPQESD